MEKLDELQCSCFWHGFWKPIVIQTVLDVKPRNNLHRCCRYVPSKEIASENHRDAMTTWWSWWPFGLSGDEANCHIAADMQTWLKQQPIWWEKTWKNTKKKQCVSFQLSAFGACFLMSFFMEVKSWNSKMMPWRYPHLSCSMLNGRSWMT